MNYYEVLKIKETASDLEIKEAYKKLVKQYHPDLYINDKEFAETKIKEINEAYSILSNPEMKSEYDNYLASLTKPKPEINSYTRTITKLFSGHLKNTPIKPSRKAYFQ